MSPDKIGSRRFNAAKSIRCCWDDGGEKLNLCFVEFNWQKIEMFWFGDIRLWETMLLDEAETKYFDHPLTWLIFHLSKDLTTDTDQVTGNTIAQLCHIAN